MNDLVESFMAGSPPYRLGAGKLVAPQQLQELVVQARHEVHSPGARKTAAVVFGESISGAPEVRCSMNDFVESFIAPSFR